MLCNSIPEGQQSVEKGSSFLGSKESSISAKQQRTKQFEEYATWCFSKGGEPSEKGFRTWRQSQGDRHKGYVIYGKFYTKKQALEMAQKNPELLDKGLFRSATRINGKITVVHQPKPQSSENGAEAA